MPKLKSSNATFSLIFKQCAQLLPLYGSTPCGDRSNGSFVMLDVTLWACSIYKRIQRCIPPLFCDTHFRKQQVTNLETKMYLRIGKNVRQFRSSQLQARYSWSFPKGMRERASSLSIILCFLFLISKRIMKQMAYLMAVIFPNVFCGLFFFLLFSHEKTLALK